jgi:hypothetical protein
MSIINDAGEFRPKRKEAVQSECVKFFSIPAGFLSFQTSYEINSPTFYEKLDLKDFDYPGQLKQLESRILRTKRF